MKKYFLMSIFLCGVLLSQAQQVNKFSLYNPKENADSALNKAIADAKKASKYVFVQIGGNWCGWCARFHEFISNDKQIDSLIKASYVVLHLNYSPENRNKDLLSDLGFPQRFGFPVFCILDENGMRIHTQNSAYLEEGEGYNKQKVMEFLSSWTPQALDPKTYKNE
ncbi:MAG TPA: thioredoxin family protein [Niastella sp.]